MRIACAMLPRGRDWMGDRLSLYEKSPNYGSNAPAWLNWAAVAGILLLGVGMTLTMAEAKSWIGPEESARRGIVSWPSALDLPLLPFFVVKIRFAGLLDARQTPLAQPIARAADPFNRFLEIGAVGGNAFAPWNRDT